MCGRIIADMRTLLKYDWGMRTLGVSVVCVVLLATSGLAAMAQDDPASRPPVPSAGCGSSEIEAGQLPGWMTVEGLDRSYVVHVPPAHDGQAPLPLVIQLHGLSSSPAAMVQTTAFHTLGRTEDFVVATPQGRGARHPAISRTQASSVGAAAATHRKATGPLASRRGTACP